MGWMGCQVAMVTHGGVGKHIWDVNYVELYWFFRVRQLRSGLRSMRSHKSHDR